MIRYVSPLSPWGCIILTRVATFLQEDKVYVQHRIPEYAGQLWEYVTRGGYIYVCG